MKNTKITVAVVVAVLMGTFLWRVSTVETVDESSIVVPVIGGDITFANEGQVVNYNGVTGVSALATLESLTDVETTSSSFGDYVTAINGIVAEDGKTYWAFFVNDEYATVGAGDYIAKDGDVIRWEIEAIEL